MKLTKLASFGMAVAMMFGCIFNVMPASEEVCAEEMREISTMDLVQEMGVGINLGNTFESCGDWIAQYTDNSVKAYETAWGSPEITKEIIQGYKNEGFGVLRVPVAWSNKIGADYTINAEYLARVKTVVEWALDCGLYVILNIHWDGGWWENFPTQKTECMKKYTTIWNQLCDAFGDYDDHLMFESLNEEGCWNSVWNQWSGTTNGKAEAYGLLNEINQTFVDLVRSSGKNNTERHLLIAGYYTDVNLTCDSMFVMPSDPQNRCAVSVHYYIPSTFAILTEDADWGKTAYTWGTDAEVNELKGYMDKLKTTFIDRGVPVIIGEYGCPTLNKDPESVRKFLTSVCEESCKREICPVLWDITGLHYSRETYTLNDTQLKASFNSIRNTYCPTVTTSEPDTAPSATVLNGTLIRDLSVYDTENASDWSIAEGLAKSDNLYGDRDITAVSLPEELNEAEYIRTACDSKMYTSTEAEFTAAKDIYVYTAVDDRVHDILSWLGDWSKTPFTVKSSNGVTFNIYSRHVSSGDKVTLGTNGGLGESANYLVFASQEELSVRGDANYDGSFSVADIVTLNKWIVSRTARELPSWKGADLTGDRSVDIFDLIMMRKMLIKPATISPEEFMTQTEAQILESEPSEATAENSGTQYGTYEKVTFTSAVCGGRQKSMNVLLPAGYTESKEYPVMYALHGYWGNADALLDAGDASLRLRQIIGNAISAGEAEEMIVVFPDIYASATQDACDGLNAKNNAAYDNFINVLTKEIMPYMEANYSIKTGRDNTAITGFSMGGRESLYIGFSRPDLFGYVGAMCPAPGLDTDCISAENLKFGDTEPYLLMITAGSNDQIVWSTPSGYHNILTNNGVRHIWHYVNGGDHGGKSIRPHVYNFVRAVFKADN